MPELLPALLGHELRLGVIMTALALFVVVLSGGLFRIFYSKIVLALLAFTAWLFVCVPFSIWHGGSFSQVVFWLISVVCLILVGGCLNDLQQCRKAMYAMAISVLFIELTSFLLGTQEHAEGGAGRFAYLFGTFANANDFATLLLIGLPFCLLAVRIQKGFSVLRLSCLLGLLIIPITVVRTGSRGGLLALIIMFLMFFFRLPSLQKVPLAILALLLTVASVLFSSDAALIRYRTILHDPDADYANDIEESAALSSRSRKELFLSSVRMSFEHPFMGVGPGMFQVADAKDAEERMHPASWHQTHNTFTQISAEEGFPGLFLYSLALFFCFQTARKARKFAMRYPDLRFLGEMAFCLRLSVVAFTITAIFASNAYYFYFPIVAGLCAALDRSMQTDLRRLEENPAKTQIASPAPRWAPPRLATGVQK